MVPERARNRLYAEAFRLEGDATHAAVRLRRRPFPGLCATNLCHERDRGTRLPQTPLDVRHHDRAVGLLTDRQAPGRCLVAGATSSPRRLERGQVVSSGRVLLRH
jgi:hypothetical protein